MSAPASFPERTDKAEVELGSVLRPKFGPDGLIPCITVDHASNKVLMFAFMNADTLAATIRTGLATYWSRSRGFWVKGQESGNVLKVKGLRVDCDQDVILLEVENAGGAACHNGYESCFYRKLAPGADPADSATLKLEFTGKPVFDPAKVYKK